MTEVRLMVVGVGGMGRHHIGNTLEVEDARITALVDPSIGSLAAAKERFPALAEIPSFENITDALNSHLADGAIIVTPHSQHFEHGMACLNAGLHVMMEKPLVAGSEQARRIIAQAQRVGRHLAVGYQRHTEGTYLYVRQLVQSGALGDIQFVTAYLAQSWLQITRGTWRQNPELSAGGQLNDSGSHMVDAVLWITGLEPEEVWASIDNCGTQVDINSAITVRFRGGALGTFNIVGNSTVGWWDELTIHGSKGTALFRNGKLLLALGSGPGSVPAEVPVSELPPGSNPAKNFVDLIQGRVAHPAAPAEYGLRVAKFTEAAWKSASLRQPVRL